MTDLYNCTLSQLDPAHTRAHGPLWEGLARARTKLRDTPGALKAWDSLLALQPGNLEALEGRIRCGGGVWGLELQLR
jgi:hypothetical protein